MVCLLCSPSQSEKIDPLSGAGWCQHVWRVHMRDSANKLLGSARLSGFPFPIFINQLRLKTRHCTPPTIVLYCD